MRQAANARTCLRLGSSAAGNRVGLGASWSGCCLYSPWGACWAHEARARCRCLWRWAAASSCAEHRQTQACPRMHTSAVSRRRHPSLAWCAEPWPGCASFRASLAWFRASLAWFRTPHHQPRSSGRGHRGCPTAVGGRPSDGHWHTGWRCRLQQCSVQSHAKKFQGRVTRRPGGKAVRLRVVRLPAKVLVLEQPRLDKGGHGHLQRVFKVGRREHGACRTRSNSDHGDDTHARNAATGVSTTSGAAAETKNNSLRRSCSRPSHGHSVMS